MPKETTPPAATRPTLETQRLVLRPFSLNDAKRVQELAGHEKVAATTATVPHPYLDGMAEAWISQHETWFENGSAIQFAITLKSTSDLIGCISLMGISKRDENAEIGYWIGVDYWNSGFCTEAMKAVVAYGFKEQRLHKLTAKHMSSNPASGRVMQKAGMIQEGILRQEIKKNGTFFDLHVYGILKEDF